MCVDYTGLNKVCPKDPFPLPRIDQIVDSTSGCETLCFLDAYSGYHQITMKESDQLATSFITPFGSFYYVTMPPALEREMERETTGSDRERERERETIGTQKRESGRGALRRVGEERRREERARGGELRAPLPIELRWERSGR